MAEYYTEFRDKRIFEPAKDDLERLRYVCQGIEEKKNDRTLFVFVAGSLPGIPSLIYVHAVSLDNERLAYNCWLY